MQSLSSVPEIQVLTKEVLEARFMGHKESYKRIASFLKSKIFEKPLDHNLNFQFVEVELDAYRLKWLLLFVWNGSDFDNQKNLFSWCVLSSYNTDLNYEVNSKLTKEEQFSSAISHFFAEKSKMEMAALARIVVASPVSA